MNSIKIVVKAALGWNWTLQGPVDLSGTSDKHKNKVLLLIFMWIHLNPSLIRTHYFTWTGTRTHLYLQQTKHCFIGPLLPPPRPDTKLDLHHQYASNIWF